MPILVLTLIASTLCLNSRSHLDYSRIESTILVKKGSGDDLISTDGGGGGTGSISTPVGSFPLNQDVHIGVVAYEGIVGRHGYINYKTKTNDGKIILNTLSNLIDPNSFNGASITINTSKTQAYSLSTNISISLDIMKGINVAAEIPGFAAISSETSINSIFKISNTKTYTASVSTTISVTYVANSGAIEKAKELNVY